MGPLYLKFFILAMTFACGWLILRYEDDTQIQEWPASTWLSPDSYFMQLMAFAAIATSVSVAVLIAANWTPIIVIIGGFVLATAASFLLKRYLQAIATVGIFIGLLLILIYVL